MEQPNKKIATATGGSHSGKANPELRIRYEVLMHKGSKTALTGSELETYRRLSNEKIVIENQINRATSNMSDEEIIGTLAGLGEAEVELKDLIAAYVKPKKK